jgi:hypothetical protein
MLLIKTDSQVVAGQVEKEYMAREPELVKYLAMVRALEQRFQGVHPETHSKFRKYRDR